MLCLGSNKDDVSKFCKGLFSMEFTVLQRELEGHYGDVYTSRFFPSGIVVLSGGSDMQLKIWSAETGQCAATLLGHTAGTVFYPELIN